MIKDIKEYSQEVYNDYMKNKDYTGLANYLDSFDIDDEVLRQDVHNTIIQLREQGRIRDGIMNNKTTNVDAVKFSENLAKGEFDNNDIYSKKFSRKLAKIGSNKNREASALEIQFNKDDGYNNFLKNSGLQENELEENGIHVKNIDGIKSIYFNKSNPLISTILNSIEYDYSMPFALNTMDLQLRAMDDPNFKDKLNRQSSISVKSYDYKGLIDDNVNGHDLLKLSNFSNRISRQAIDAFNKAAEDPKISTRTTTVILTGFTSAGRTQLEYDRANGVIDRETYNSLKDNIEKHDYALLDGVSLTNYDEVYVKSPKSKTAELTIETDSKELGDLSVLLHQALDEGRVKMQAALVGNKTGTYITINAKNPRGSSNKSSEDLSTGKITGETIIFVPNLLQGECEEAFNRDTKTRATKEKWNLQTYEYPYYFDDGSSVRYIYQQNPNTGSIKQIGLYKDRSGNELPISDEEIINKLNRQFIEDEGTYNLYYQRKMSDFYKNNKREDFDNLKDANPDILEYCKAAMEELFPGLNPQSEQYEFELQKLFDEMYNKLKNYKL